jgi:cation diffusion facilitator CzcD-associated flavoprotein CzcO
MFRFTIRDVLWLTVVVALGLGWWMNHRRQSNDVQTLLDVIRHETPWLVENDHADWSMNQMRQEAQPRRGQLPAER